MRYIIPAIDLRGGKVVRLTQGQFDRQTNYAEDPADLALRFVSEGAKRIHVVDLDGARLGQPQAINTIKQIIAQVPADYQIGGGIRDPKTIESYLALGVHRVVCGSLACLDKVFLQEVLSAFSQHLIVGVDTKDGMVATHGWTKISSLRVEDLVERVLALGGKEIIYTDIATDGMLAGPNIPAIEHVLKLGPVEVIASGGIASLADIDRLLDINSERLVGAIIGKALYEGKIELNSAIKRMEAKE